MKINTNPLWFQRKLKIQKNGAIEGNLYLKLQFKKSFQTSKKHKFIYHKISLHVGKFIITNQL